MICTRYMEVWHEWRYYDARKYDLYKQQNTHNTQYSNKQIVAPISLVFT